METAYPAISRFGAAHCLPFGQIIVYCKSETGSAFFGPPFTSIAEPNTCLSALR